CSRSLSLSLHLSALTFLFTASTPTELYTLSLHDALPISDCRRVAGLSAGHHAGEPPARDQGERPQHHRPRAARDVHGHRGRPGRSEEHTSELQSHLNLVCRLLLEKKKTE